MSNQKVVLVTGGSAGIGEATAIEFAKLGYKVAITGRNEERLDKVLKKLVSVSPSNSKGDDFLALKADFGDPKQVESVVPETIQKFSGIDILVNNAGFSGGRIDFESAGFYDDFKEILQVNLFASVRIAQLATSYLIKSKGVIVNVSSIADRLAMPTVSYSVSKAGLSMVTKCLANSFEGKGVRVVTVAPGPIKTNFAEGIEAFGPMTSLLRAGESQEVANAIVFLASDKASYVHGCTLDVDGGCYSKFGGVFNNLREILPE